MSYITRKDIEGLGDQFSIPPAYQSADISTIISEVEEYIDDITKNNFTEGGINKVLEVDGTGTESLFLFPYTSLPILSITSIKERTDPTVSWSSSSVSTIDSDTYYIPEGDRHRIDISIGADTIRTIITTPGTWTKGQANYRIEGKFGHGSCPYPVKLACVYLARERMKPGYIKSIMVMQEKWSDYQYIAMPGWERRYGREIPIYTGWAIIDVLIRPYVMRKIDLGVV